MRYYAKTLEHVYWILRMLQGPLAVLDFFCGSVGGEVTGSQSIGGWFYDELNQRARIVALCWKGASILYSNVSHDQIEVVDAELSRLGDQAGEGWKKKCVLAENGHAIRISRMPHVIAHSGPHDATAKGMRRHYELDTAERWEVISERLARTGYVFSSGPPLVEEPYIAIFDRNEEIQWDRNTRMWQVNFFRWLVRRLGLGLVVISDFYPFLWLDVIRMSFADRDFDRLCNIISNAILYAAPASGSANAGLVFGCNFVSLGVAQWRDWDEIIEDIQPKVVEGRGFQFFGVMDTPDSDAMQRVEKYLEERCPK